MKLTVKIAEQTYQVEVGDLNIRPIIATVNRQTFEVFVDDQPDHADQPKVAAVVAAIPVAPAPLDKKPLNGADRMIVSPIPGMIVAIAVQAGACVTKGQEVCTLETMKMKNLIRAPFDGQIKAILVSVGETVKQKQSLMEYVEP